MRAVDLFAGWGGFTEGATQAGAEVVYAANHWPLAVEAHAANHPMTAHECQDLHQADWAALPEHDLLLASPACQGHSPAANAARTDAGVAATHDALRATAWAVIGCVEVCRPRAAIVENVPAFRRWGPKERPGAFFEHWLQGLRLRGYTVETRILRASRHGTPQRRDRLFVLATRGFEVPELVPTEEPAFGPCIEWDAPARWRRVEKSTPGVRRRIERSRVRHGDRFLTQHTRDHMGVPLDEPVRTITTKDQWAVVRGDEYRPFTVRETARAMGFPDSYEWPDFAKRSELMRGLGNAVCPPVARAVVQAVMEAA